MDFFAKGPDRVFTFKLGDEGATLRWIISLRAVHLCTMKSWKNGKCVQICELLEISKDGAKKVGESGIVGDKLARIKAKDEITGVTGVDNPKDIDKIWTHLQNIRAGPVLNWLSRFSAFCQSLVKKRAMTDVEMSALTDLSWGITVINEANGTDKSVDEITESMEDVSFFEKEQVDLENVNTAVVDDV